MKIEPVFSKRVFRAAAVKESQSLVNELIEHLKIEVRPIKVDGVYGQQTFKAWRAVQSELKRLGFYTGKIDGLHGPLTSKAVLKFFESSSPDRLLTEKVDRIRRSSENYLTHPQSRALISQKDRATRLGQTRRNEFATFSGPRGVSSEHVSPIDGDLLHSIEVPNFVRRGLSTVASSEVTNARISLKPGQQFSSREVLTVVANLRSKLRSADPDFRKDITNTLVFFENLLEKYPQAVRFRVVEQNSKMLIVPSLIQTKIIKEGGQFDVIVLGAEVESVGAAIESARRGKRVALVIPAHFGENGLGGLSAPVGSNMRFFDFPTAGNQPAEFWEMIKILGLNKQNRNSVDKTVSRRLLAALQETGRIQIIKIKSFDNFQAEKNGRRIESIVVDVDGLGPTRFRGKVFIDTDPEGRLVEKTIGRPTSMAPRMGYGLVFDVYGLTRREMEQLIITHNERVLQRVLGKLGISESELSRNRTLKMLVDNYRRAYDDTTNRNFNDLQKWGDRSWGGGRQLKLLYDIYTVGKFIKNPTDEDLAKIVRYRFLGLKSTNIRRADGFNIAVFDSHFTLNSLHYALPFKPLQYSHKVGVGELSFLAKERVMLEEFFKLLSGRNVSISLPGELYIRSSGVDFSRYSMRRYSVADLSLNGEIGYQNDLRALYLWHQNPSIYVKLSQQNILKNGHIPRGKLSWNVNPDACRVIGVDNLYAVNKSMFPPELFGAMRIQPNLYLHAVRVAKKID